MCLDFTLAAQDEDRQVAYEKLMSQVREYIVDSVVGPDAKFANQLLRRRAPAKFWIKYFWFGALLKIAHIRDRRHVAKRHPLHLVPA